MPLQPSTANWVVVGQFGRPHGVRGMVNVHSFTEPRDNITAYTPWYISIRDEWRPVTILTIESTHKCILAKIEGYATREEVAALTNCPIAIGQEQLPTLPEGEYYWRDLIGMEVCSPDATLGTVREILPTGAHDVLVIEGEKRHLIPYIMGKFITEINPVERRITVNWDVDF